MLNAKPAFPHARFTASLLLHRYYITSNHLLYYSSFVMKSEVKTPYSPEKAVIFASAKITTCFLFLQPHLSQQFPSKPIPDWHVY